MLWTAFLLGLFGGLHCIGMCGPITLALPAHKNIGLELIAKTLYNSGRIMTYTVFGAVAGVIGQGFSVAGWQQGLSVFTGVFLILLVIITGSANLDLAFLKPVVRLADFLKSKFRFYIKKRSLGSVIVIGVLNGFLPCGLVYVAIAGALAGGSIANGAAYMAIFGMGTFPWMFAFAFGGSFISGRLRQKIYRFVPAFIFVLGILFILRGLNLGIPYISPKLKRTESGSVQIEMCEPGRP